MISPFPDSPRVIYHKNPLVEVICQLRFAPILRIDVEPPARFQEAIRSDYPILKDRSPGVLELPSEVPSAVASIIQSALGKPKVQAAYDFVSADGIWTVSLTRAFLSLSTKSYRRWEEFVGHLEHPLAALIENYSPLFTRVGLRYLNLVRPKPLGLQSKPWAALLKGHVTGMFSAPGLKAEIVQTVTQTLIQFPDDMGFVMIRHGLAEAPDDPDPCYLIDNDFYTEKRLEADHVYEKLNFFNQQSGRLFRWCIDDLLHDAMEPDVVQDLL